MKHQTLAERLSLARLLLPKRTLRIDSAAVRMARTRDHMTYDAQGHHTIDNMGNQRGIALPWPSEYRYRTADGQELTRTYDSTGALLVGELERLDPTLHMPLMEVSWPRDIDLREDVTIADEISSFMLTSFAAGPSLGTGAGIRRGKAWIGKSTDQIAGVDVDIGKVPGPLRPWGREIKFTILELESAARMGRPIDDQKIDALKRTHQMDIDAQVYVGDADTGDTGLVNHTLVTNVSNVPNGALGTPAWSTKTPSEILADLNAIIMSAWAATSWKVMPNRIGLPPLQYGYVATQLVSGAGSQSILKYLLENNVLVASRQGNLDIVPMKWLVGAGAGGTLGTPGIDRMIAYRKEKQYVRYPMTMLQRTPIQYESIYHKTTYYCRLGVVEVVYPETLAYRDGI